MALSFSVPKIALGTAPIGSMAPVFGYAVSDEDARATIERALSAGVNFIDTAPLYGNGISETRIGDALEAAGMPRAEVILGTKIGWLPGKLGGSHFSDGERSYSRDAVRRSVEGSLKRLRTDYLDIVHVHDPDLGDFRKAVLDEAYPELNALKREGVIRAIGAGLNQWEYVADIARNAEIDCCLLAGRYSLLEQAPLETFFPLMLEKRISVFLGGVFNSGILATGPVKGARYQYAPAPEPILRLARLLEGVCTRHGVSLRAAAAQFAAAHPAVTTLVLGMVKPAEVDDNMGLLTQPVPAALWAELKARELIDASAPVPGG
jgi:D-threo-aldose 1-dehydrogenase